MPKDSRTLFENEWITVDETPEGYVFIRNGTERAIVALPYTRDTGAGLAKYLARIEPIPCHDPDRHLCALTGMVEEGEGPMDAAVREVFEESGYRVAPGQMLDLGPVFPSKASTTVMYMYAVDVTDLHREEAPGDGTEAEEQSSTAWLTLDEALRVPDAVFVACLGRLRLAQEWFGR
jgi:8-oxo-dGTP pyrophosphatase MutT (NUDIX family)